MKLRDLRRRAGWTQRDLADRAQLRAATICRIETGQTRDYMQSTVAKLAKAFRLPEPTIAAALRADTRRA